MTFYLEKYRTDRTFFGSAKLMQGGHWTMLYRPMVPLFLAVVACGLWTLWVMVLQPIGPFFDLFLRGFVAGAAGVEIDVEGLEDGPSQAVWRLWLLLPLVFAVYVGVVHYIFGARRMMANHKSVPGITFASKLRTGRVAWIYAGGTILAYLVLVLGLLLLLIILVPVIGLNVLNNVGGIDAGVIGTAPRWLTITASVILYFGVFLMWSVVYNTFVTFPLMRHMAGTLSLPTHDGLQDISQVARDEFAEAEGFAEALDLGAAI